MDNKGKIKIIIDFIYDNTIDEKIIDKILLDDNELFVLFFNVLSLKIETKKTKLEVVNLFTDARKSLEYYIN